MKEQKSLKAAAEAAKPMSEPVKKGCKVKQLLRNVANKVANNPKFVKAGAKLAKAGKQFVKAIPFLGVGAGIASAGYAASQGDRVGAALGTVGLVPGVGDVVDAARGGYALGEAAGELLVDSDMAMSHGDVAMNAARKIGLGETGSAVVGGVVAARSAVLQATVNLNPISWLF